MSFQKLEGVKVVFISEMFLIRVFPNGYWRRKVSEIMGSFEVTYNINYILNYHKLTLKLCYIKHNLKNIYLYEKVTLKILHNILELH